MPFIYTYLHGNASAIGIVSPSMTGLLIYMNTDWTTICGSSPYFKFFLGFSIIKNPYIHNMESSKDMILSAADSEPSQRRGGPVVPGPAPSISCDGLRGELPAGSPREPVTAEDVASSPASILTWSTLTVDEPGWLPSFTSGNEKMINLTDEDFLSAAEQWATTSRNVASPKGVNRPPLVSPGGVSGVTEGF